MRPSRVARAGAAMGGRMLQGTRVIELSTDVAGAFTGRLLALYGADVVVVEPPEGHPVRHLPPWPASPDAAAHPDDSVLFAYLGAGKRSAVLDLTTAEGVARARALVDGADVVIDSGAPGRLAALGLDLAAMSEARPALVVLQISPYGQDGPRAGWRASAVSAFATGGQMAACGDPDMPPLKTAGHQAFYFAGLHGFASTLTALYAAHATGVGDRLDLSIQELHVAGIEGQMANALARGGDSARITGNNMYAQWGIQPCADGYIGIAAMPRQSFSVYDAIGHPEFKDDPAFASGWSPAANEVLSALIPAWTMERTAEDIFRIGSEVRAPFSRILTPRELYEWPHLAEIGFWKQVDHPRLGRHPLPSGPIQFDGTQPGSYRGENRRAPLLGEHTDAVLAEAPRPTSTPAPTPEGQEAPALPFAGLRVVDVSQVWAGPYATRLLADMGAEVVKIEGPTYPDPIRTMSGARTVPEINQVPYFNEYGRNKLGVSLDLKQPEGVEALRKLIRTADVFIENWSSGVADRQGLGYEDVKRLKPDIIYVSMPGFGHVGSDASRIGFGPTIEQMGGLAALQGYEGRAPHRSAISYGDPIAGTTAAAGVALALLRRQRTGEPAYVMVAQRDGIAGLISEYVIGEVLGCPLPMRIGDRDAHFAPSNAYPAADGPDRPIMDINGNPIGAVRDRWLTLTVDSDAAWGALRGIIDDARLDDPAYATRAGRAAAHDAIDAVIAEWSAVRDAEESAARLQAAGVIAAPILSPLMLTTDTHLEARGAFVWYDHPEAGRVRTTRPTWRMARRPITGVRAAPRFGADTDEVLRSLGYSDADVHDFAERRVTSTALAE
ncbi:MAG: CaiB/BaiF CoA transferase family protein [Dehalococcoidia bacterium]